MDQITLMITAFGAFGILGFSLKWVMNISTKDKIEMRKLRKVNVSYSIASSKLGKMVEAKQQKIDILKNQIDSARIERLLGQDPLDDDSNNKSNKPKDIVDVLISQGAVTQASIQKAEAYKAKTKSPQSVEEILLLLDIVDSKTLTAAKEVFRNSQ